MSPTAGGSPSSGSSSWTISPSALRARTDGPRPTVGGPDDAGRDPRAGRRRPDRRRCDRAPPRSRRRASTAATRASADAGIGVDVGDLLAGRGHRGATRSLAVERPDHRRVDGAHERIRARRRGPGRRRRRVATPLKTSPLNSSAPFTSPRRSATLCGAPGSLFSNTTWNGVSAGAVTVVCSNLMLSALISTRFGLPDPAGPLASADAARSAVGVTDGAGQIGPAGAGVGAAGDDRGGQQGEPSGSARNAWASGPLVIADGRVGCSGWNLPRRPVSCPERLERGGAVAVRRGDWYSRVPPDQYHRPGCSASEAPLVSPSTFTWEVDPLHSPGSPDP